MVNHKGIAYREAAQVAFIDMAAAPNTASARPMKSVPAPDEQTLSTMPWSPWGKNNLLPQEMVADIESTGVLSAIIEGKARLALCEGLAPAIVERDKNGVKVVKEWINDPEITSFLKSNNSFFQCMGWMRDLFGLANGGVQFMVNGEKNKIVKFKRFDASEMRYQKEDNKGNIANIYLSANWDTITSAKDNRLVTIPLLDPNNPVEDLKEKVGKGIVEHALTIKYPSWGKHYYSVPLWYAAYKWVKIAQGVPEMKAAMFQNIMRLKYMVIIYPKYWEDAFPGAWDKFTAEEKEKKREELFDEINDYLIGAKNAHKSLFTDGVYDSINGKQYANIEIKPIEDNTAQGEYNVDSAAANSEISIAMLWNLAMQGGNQASGLYESSQGGSNVRESFLMQVLLHVFERELINYLLWPVIAFNGWDQKYPGMEFVIPATILTTTDTGGSTKPTIKQDGANNNNSGNKDAAAAAGK